MRLFCRYLFMIMGILILLIGTGMLWYSALLAEYDLAKMCIEDFQNACATLVLLLIGIICLIMGSLFKK